jgi:hypothetical protein
MNNFKVLALVITLISSHLLAIDGAPQSKVSPEELATLCKILGKCGPDELGVLLPELKMLGKRVNLRDLEELPGAKKTKTDEELPSIDITHEGFPVPVVLPEPIANSCTSVATPGSESPKPGAPAVEAAKLPPSFGLSPGSASVTRTIYRHYVKVEGAYYPKEDRFDVGAMWPKGGGLNKENLHKVMLQIEMSVLKKLEEQPGLMLTTVYIGQAKEIDHRFSGHRRELVLHAGEKITRKAVVEGQILSLDKESINMSYLADEIPIKYLDILECFFAELFNVLGRGGASAVIGNEAAWDDLREYQKWDVRIKTLEDAGYTNLLNKLIALSAPNWVELAKMTLPK